MNKLQLGGKPSNRFVITERRERVFVMLSQGLSETEIANELNVGQSTVCRDVKSIKKESQKQIESIAEDVLPYEYNKCLVSMEQVIKEGWKIYHDTSEQWTNKNKIDILKLIKEAVRTRFEILGKGPLALNAKEVSQKVKELTEGSEIPKSFFTLGPPPGGYYTLTPFA